MVKFECGKTVVLFPGLHSQLVLVSFPDLNVHLPKILSCPIDPLYVWRGTGVLSNIFVTWGWG